MQCLGNQRVGRGHGFTADFERRPLPLRRVGRLVAQVAVDRGKLKRLHTVVTRGDFRKPLATWMK
jgi:hypothetical protein